MAEHLQEINQLDDTAEKAARVISCLSALQSGGNVVLYVPPTEPGVSPLTFTFAPKSSSKIISQ